VAVELELECLRVDAWAVPDFITVVLSSQQFVDRIDPAYVLQTVNDNAFLSLL